MFIDPHYCQVPNVFPAIISWSKPSFIFHTAVPSCSLQKLACTALHVPALIGHSFPFLMPIPHWFLSDVSLIECSDLNSEVLPCSALIMWVSDHNIIFSTSGLAELLSACSNVLDMFWKLTNSNNKQGIIKTTKRDGKTKKDVFSVCLMKTISNSYHLCTYYVQLLFIVHFLCNFITSLAVCLVNLKREKNDALILCP